MLGDEREAELRKEIRRRELQRQLHVRHTRGVHGAACSDMGQAFVVGRLLAGCKRRTRL